MSRSHTCVAAVDHVANVSSVVSMADFSRPPSRISRDERDRQGGVLLLFTGVRYERQIEPAEPVAEGGRTRRRRRR
jgi:hypothetical protein